MIKPTKSYIRYRLYMASGRVIKTKWIPNTTNITNDLGNPEIYQFIINNGKLISIVNAHHVESIEYETKER